MRKLAALLLPLLILGCSNTYAVLQQEDHLAQFKVTTSPPGARLTLDQEAQGTTPTTATLRYTSARKRVYNGAYKNGWILLATGIAATATGTGLTVWASRSLADSGTGGESKVGQAVTVSFATALALYGVYGLIAGIYYLATTKRYSDYTEVTPQGVSLELDVPGFGREQVYLQHRSLRPDLRPPFDKLEQIHFDASQNSWAAPGMPNSLELIDHRSGKPLRVATLLPEPGEPSLQQEPPARGNSAPLQLVEKLRKHGEQCYRQRDYRCALNKFERAFALMPSAAMRFNLASTLDKLGRAALAVRQYRRYLQDAGDSVSPSAVAHIQRRMKTLLPQVSRLQLSVTPADAVVSLDGVDTKTLGATLTAGQLELVLEPGSHRLDISHPCRQPQSRQIALQAGEIRALKLALPQSECSQP